MQTLGSITELGIYKFKLINNPDWNMIVPDSNGLSLNQFLTNAWDGIYMIVGKTEHKLLCKSTQGFPEHTTEVFNLDTYNNFMYFEKVEGPVVLNVLP